MLSVSSLHKSNEKDCADASELRMQHEIQVDRLGLKRTPEKLLAFRRHA